MCIRDRLEIKSMLKDKVELSKDVIDKFLVLNKNDRLKFMDSLNEERMLDFKRKLYKRIITEKNAEDLMILDVYKRQACEIAPIILSP